VAAIFFQQAVTLQIHHKNWKQLQFLVGLCIFYNILSVTCVQIVTISRKMSKSEKKTEVPFNGLLVPFSGRRIF